LELLIAPGGYDQIELIEMQINTTQNQTKKGKLDSDVLLITNEVNAILSDPVKYLDTYGERTFFLELLQI
jgi:hypothetical protein